MGTRIRPHTRLDGLQVGSAREAVATCVLGPALDTGPDADPATRAEARDAGRALSHLGWPGPAPAAVLLDREDTAVVRRAALAALAAAADTLQEEATGAVADGIDPELAGPLGELDAARALLDAVGWSDADGPAAD